MKKLIIILTLLTVGCSQYTYKDLIIPADLKPDYKSPENISSKQLKEDTGLLKYALKKAYGGRFVISKEILKNAYDELDAIQGDMTTQKYCDQIGEALAKIPDYHLHVRYNGALCPKTEKKTPSSIGENIAKGKTWVVEKRKYKGKNYLLIAISGFPSNQSKKWDGFMEQVKKLHNPKLPVVFDLRSNGGGDDTFGYRLSAFFHKASEGLNFPTPYEKQITSQTAETQVLKMNVADFWLRGEVSETEPLISYRTEQENILKEILSGKLPEKKVSINDKVSENWTFSGYPNPIYILMNEHCFSSCESTIDSFEYNPHVKKIGLATGGMIHFGNVSPLFLKHSRVYIQIATHANTYFDGRFIEKKGIQPDIEVPAGKDALEYTLENYLN